MITEYGIEAALFSNSTRILCNMDGILHHWLRRWILFMYKELSLCQETEKNYMPVCLSS